MLGFLNPMPAQLLLLLLLGQLAVLCLLRSARPKPRRILLLPKPAKLPLLAKAASSSQMLTLPSLTHLTSAQILKALPPLQLPLWHWMMPRCLLPVNFLTVGEASPVASLQRAAQLVHLCWTRVTVSSLLMAVLQRRLTWGKVTIRQRMTILQIHLCWNQASVRAAAAVVQAAVGAAGSHQCMSQTLASLRTHRGELISSLVLLASMMPGQMLRLSCKSSNSKSRP